MRRFLRALGVLALVLAALLALLAIASWPPGGPMFAAPYFFLIPAVPLGAGGVALLLLTRAPPREGSGS